MEQKKFIGLVTDAISKNKNGVLESLRDADVVVPVFSNDKELLKIVIDEIYQGNGYLAFYLGEVIDNLNKGESNWVGIAVAAGTAIYGAYQANQDKKDAKKAAKKAQQAAAAAAAAEAERKRKAAELFKKKMEMAASKRLADKIKREADFKAKRNSSLRSIASFSLIGAALIAGVIISIKIIKNK